MFDAPIDLRKLVDEDFPVIAETSLPSMEINITAIEPTPPVAPETKTGKSEFFDDSYIFNTLAAAVNPAVPIDIASKLDKLAGFLTTHPAGTLINSPKPPGVFIPMS